MPPLNRRFENTYEVRLVIWGAYDLPPGSIYQYNQKCLIINENNIINWNNIEWNAFFTLSNMIIYLFIFIGCSADPAIAPKLLSI